MKKTKLITAISVALAASLTLSVPSYAAKRDSKAQPAGEQVLPHSQQARQKVQHDQRKKAAQRLKAAYSKARAQKMARDVKAHGHYRRAK